VSDDEDTLWFDGGYIRNKKTRRWHAVVRLRDEIIISEASFATREEALEHLKLSTEELGAQYSPIQ
jgi:hypothetical protein